jgi:CDP-diacylglycerol--serine O-phosphatidyltransferase
MKLYHHVHPHHTVASLKAEQARTPAGSLSRGLADALTLGVLAAGLWTLWRRPPLELALLVIGAAAVADALDGPLARASGGPAPYGRYLDGVADMVAFGLAPAVLLGADNGPQRVVAAVYAIAAASRLIRNIRHPSPFPADYHRGLPLPAAAGLFAGGAAVGGSTGLWMAGLLASALALGRVPYERPGRLLKAHLAVVTIGCTAAAVMALTDPGMAVFSLSAVYALAPIVRLRPQSS